jgi:chromosome segregation ATPase
MARTGVTYFDVSKAATKLVEQDKNPTVDSVRGELGTGSKSTIGPLLKEWKSKQEGWQGVKETGLPTALISSVKGLYEGLQEEAANKVKEIKESAMQKVNAANTQAEEANSKARALAREVTELKEALASSKQNNAALSRALQEEGQSRKVSDIYLKSAKEIIESNKSEIEKLDRANQSAQGNIGRLMAAAKKQKQEDQDSFDQMRSALERSLIQARRENESLLSQAEQMAAELREQQERGDQLSQACKQVEDKRRALEVSQEKAESEIKERTAVIANLTAEHSQLTDEKNNLKETLIAGKIQTGIMQEKLSAADISNEKLHTKIEQLENKVLFLAQEKATLSEQLKTFQKRIKNEK